MASQARSVAAGSAFRGAAVAVPLKRRSAACGRRMAVRAELGAPVPMNGSTAKAAPVASVQVAQVANTAAPPAPAVGAWRAGRLGRACGARAIRCR